MAPKRWKTGLKKFFKYLALGGFTILLSVWLGLRGFPSVVELARVDAAVPDAPTAEVSTRNAFQLVQQGLQHYQADQFAAAVTLWQQAADTFAEQGDRLNQAMVLSNLALAYHQLGQWSKANRAIATSLQLLQTEDGTSDRLKILAQALNTQGKLQLAQGRAEQALATWQKATKTYQQVGDKTGVVRSFINQAQALRVLGFYQRVKDTLEQASQILQDQPYSAIKAAGLLSFGDALRLVGDLKKSQEVLQQSLAISQQLQSPPAITAALLSMGNTAQAQLQIDEALKYYQQAIASSTSPTTTLQAQLNQLHLLIEAEKWAEAQALSSTIQQQQANLPVSRTAIYARINFTQSLMKLWSQKSGVESREVPTPQTAAQILATASQQAKELGDKWAESYALGYLGQVYEQLQQWSEAQTLTEKALLLAQSSNAPDIAYLWQWQLGRLLKVQAREEKANSSAYISAIGAYKEAINTLKSLRNDLVATNLDLQFSFRESVEPVYRQLVGLLLAGGTQTSQENLKQAREVIESLQLAELDNFFREACLTAQPEQIDRVDSKAAVIYPIILPDRLEVILSLPNQTLSHYATPIRQSELEDTLDKARRSLRRTALDEERLPLFQKGYDWLVRPVESVLATSGIETLVFALDGSLKNLPLAALHDGQRYLVEKYSVAVTPSLQLLQPRPLAREQIKILIGGLSEARLGFLPLPGVEVEVKQIKDEIPAAQVLFNQQFTSTALQQEIKAAPFPVVHLATHGQFSSNAENTFILAWNERISVKQLGRLLEAREQNDRKPIELLVLSACQTAAGDNRAALGLAGVAVRSGARSTLATLWPVDDRSTSDFMGEFYQALAQSQVTKAQAVRQAQLALLKQPKFRHPFYWAPFVLIGNWL
ncbi:MAG TPA: CHAT domain-containing protein [Coleofasciculaceae cyanobacterium]|jgi:CHAT domain-containing protein/tetratricopeptide (TPR) repeat protein